ncbi:uncharacterized protein LOC129609842 [Condylostylus longicornis]|uniref:uncharacterized protein LOC129609842 n=1 Tax=Condylostylus longicornis TaxID=2530218 RepID=UPI00244E0E65|nr:uncharacterized protein LOC129609842 [Condylostylus longicornis]
MALYASDLPSFPKKQIIQNAIRIEIPVFNPGNNGTDLYSNAILCRLRKYKSQLLSAKYALLKNLPDRNHQTIIRTSVLLKNVSILIKENLKISISNYWKNRIKNIKSSNSKINAGVNLNLLEKHSVHPETAYRNSAIANKVDSAISNFNTITQEYECNEISLVEFNNELKSNKISSLQNKDNYFTTLEDLKSIFSGLKGKISSGIDGIPNLVLKNLPDSIIEKYCIIFNNCLNLSYFPEIWKKAKVVTIKKPGKISIDPSSFRPISLLPNYKNRHSTIHAMTKLSSDICWHINDQKCVAACFVDLEKAFDTVWLDGLIYGLIGYGFPLYLIILINNMIRNKTFRVVSSRGKYSKEFAVLSGLQQGTQQQQHQQQLQQQEEDNFNLEQQLKQLELQQLQYQQFNGALL